jgi:hypothetical protein
VDVYDAFPYVETRTYAIVSDPAWNRLVFGEAGKTLRAYDGAGTTLGKLSQPRGLAVDESVASTSPTRATTGCWSCRRAPNSIRSLSRRSTRFAGLHAPERRGVFRRRHAIQAR